MSGEQWLCCDVCQSPNPMDSVECHVCEEFLFAKHLQLYEETSPGVIELTSEVIFYTLSDEDE